MLTSATLSVALVGVISGLFGMNLHNTYEDSYNTFVLVRPPMLPAPWKQDCYLNVRSITS